MDVLSFITDAITLIFLLVILSYYILLLIPRVKPPIEKRFDSITVIIPAHNEEEFISESIRSVLFARFPGKKQIIAVDDGSSDRTYSIMKGFEKDGVKVIQTPHSGKSSTLNRALEDAEGELIAVVDGDSEISRDSLVYLSDEISRKNVAAATCIVKVKNRNRFLCLWPHVELLYNSLIRSIFAKINANVTTPGPLSMYRKKELNDIGGFSTDGFSEDVDVTIRLIRKGYRISFSEKAVSCTNMPYRPRDFLRQRFRFTRGLIRVFKKHLKLNKAMIDIYTLPLLLFMYIQGVIMGLFTFYQIISGYIEYFVAFGKYFSLDVLIFFFEWISLYGFARWVINVFSGQVSVTPIVYVGILSATLSYPLLVYSVLRYDRKLDLLHLITLFFMTPFWWLAMAIQVLSLPELFRKSQYNIWKKNER